MSELIRKVKQFYDWQKAFRDRLHHGPESKQFREKYLKVAFADYKRSYPGSKSVLSWIAWLTFTSIIMLFFTFTGRHHLLFLILFLVIFGILLIVLNSFYRIMVEVDEVATKAVRIERELRKKGKDSKSAEDAAVKQIQDGSISRTINEERKRVMEKQYHPQRRPGFQPNPNAPRTTRYRRPPN